MAGPEGFEPSTIPRTSLIFGLVLQVKSFSLRSLLLYLAEPPDQTGLLVWLTGPKTRRPRLELRFLIRVFVSERRLPGIAPVERKFEPDFLARRYCCPFQLNLRVTQRFPIQSLTRNPPAIRGQTSRNEGFHEDKPPSVHRIHSRHTNSGRSLSRGGQPHLYSNHKSIGPRKPRHHCNSYDYDKQWIAQPSLRHLPSSRQAECHRPSYHNPEHRRR